MTWAKCLWHRWSDVASPKSQFILQPFRRFTYIITSLLLLLLLCVCFNANPLHYYALQAPRKADKWRWVGSIFESRTAWAYHITCGTSVCIVFSRKYSSFSSFPSLHLRHSSFSNPSVALPTSQLILQPFSRFYLRHMLSSPSWLKQFAFECSFLVPLTVLRCVGGSEKDTTKCSASVRGNTVFIWIALPTLTSILPVTRQLCPEPLFTGVVKVTFRLVQTTVLRPQKHNALPSYFFLVYLLRVPHNTAKQILSSL